MDKSFPAALTMTALPAAGVASKRLTQTEVDIICTRHERLWSARPGGARAVFAFADISGLTLAGRNLADTDFSGAIMAGVNFDGCKLDNAVLFGADMQGATFREASLRRADLRGACLRGADLTGADMFEADLREGSIAAADKKMGYRVIEHQNRFGAQGVILAGANLERSRLSGIIAIRADFTDAVMKDAKLVRANLKQANLSGANMEGCDLSGADVSGADLTDAILVGANTYAWNASDAKMTGCLTDKPMGKDVNDLPYGEMITAHAAWCETGGREGTPSVFDNADLRSLKSLKGLNLTALSGRGAIFYALDLEGVQMQGAMLEGADLRGCNLRRADLRGARLKGAKLSGADLRDAHLGPLIIGPDRTLPVDLTGASLKNCDLARADLRQARLAGADLSWANFTNANLREAEFTGVVRTGARGLQDAL